MLNYNWIWILRHFVLRVYKQTAGIVAMFHHLYSTVCDTEDAHLAHYLGHLKSTCGIHVSSDDRDAIVCLL